MPMTPGDERVSPRTGSTATRGVRVATRAGQFDGRGATEFRAQLHSAGKPGVEWMVGRLEGDNQEAARSVAGPAEQRLTLVEDAAVGGPQATLSQRAGGATGIFEALELERSRG